MPGIPSICTFDINTSNVYVEINYDTNTITVTRFNLSKENAAALSYLVNEGGELTIKIKKKEIV